MPANGPIELMEAGKVGIRRYWKVRADANPYDPEWELYLEERLRWQLEGTLAGRSRIEYLLRGGICCSGINHLSVYMSLGP